MDAHKRPRVLLCAGGSRGDVEPVLHVARAIQRRGVEARLLCHAEWSRLADGTGLSFWPLAGSSSHSRGRDGRMEEGEAKQTWQKQLQDLEAASEGVDCILFNWFTVYAIHLAEKMQVPAVALWLTPFTRTKEFPCFFFAKSMLAAQGKERQIALPQTPLGNYKSYVLQEYVCWKPFERQINQWRRQLGLPPAPQGGHFLSMLQKRTLTLCGWSPAVVPKPADWNDHTFVCGYFHDTAAPLQQQLSAPVEEFLAAGDVPIFIGLGSTATDEKSKVLRRLVEAAIGLEHRVILCHGDDLGLAHEGLLWIKEAPHNLLFPRCRLIVHHGGAGTAGMAFTSGVPQLACPVEFDQYFWADRACTLEVCAGCLPARLIASQMRIEDLQEHMRACLDPRHVSHACALGQRLQQEFNGSALAAEYVLAYLKHWRPPFR